MTRMTGPHCAVMSNLIYTDTHTHTHTYTHIHAHVHAHIHTHTRRQERVGSVIAKPDDVGNSKEAGGVPGAQVRTVQVERVCPLCRV